MLYYLSDHFPALFVLHYITVRALIGFGLAFGFTLLLMPPFVRWARAKKLGQPILHHVEGHKGKSDTPTMGGVVFIGAAVVAALLSARVLDPFVLLVLGALLAFMGIGMVDDLAKIHHRRNDAGLSARAKFALQMVVALGVGAALVLLGFPSTFYAPFFKSALFDMGWMAVPFWALVIVATSNAVNLTDGLDGLAAGPSFFAFITLSALLYVTGNAVLSGYLLWPKITMISELSIIAVCLAGAILGFLWHNAYPAEVFMGDSGSLALGAVMGIFAIAAKSELLLFVIGLIFVVETASVILQVGSYRTRGRRMFLMAPIHHHFELKQWHENKIIVRFWIVALLSNLAALLTLKIR